MTRIASGRPAPRYGALGTLLVTTEKPSARNAGTLYCEGRWLIVFVGSWTEKQW